MIDAYTAADIENADIKKPQMIVENLLTAGLTVLAGSPKLGKSWLVLLLCICVANGIDFLNHPTIQGDCLYLDLEGSQYRMQNRLSQLDLGFPEALQISHESARLNNGLMDELYNWWSCANNPKLIVIDTIVKVKSQGKRGQNAYEADSDMFAPLQKFALENRIGIVVVTHLKKSNSYTGTEEDWLERITGSMGLSGVSDNVWGLFRKRGENTAYLRTSSRDINAGDTVLHFNNGLWEFVSDNLDEFQFREQPLIKFLISLVNFHDYATELYNQYQAFCDENQIPTGLSETQPVTSLGKQLKAVQCDLWRIRKMLHIERKKNGTIYSINTM